MHKKTIRDILLAGKRPGHAQYFLGCGDTGQHLVNAVLLQRNHALFNGLFVDLIGIRCFQNQSFNIIIHDHNFKDRRAAAESGMHAKIAAFFSVEGVVLQY